MDDVIVHGEKIMDDVIAEHVLGSRFSDLDDSALAATKHHILHTLVTVIGGSNAPGIVPVHELAVATGGTGSSTVLVYGSKMTAMNAALVNSTMAHALDYDMNDDRTFYKSSVAVVPTALALAEELGVVDGKEFITAVCVGIDLGIRIGLAVSPQPAHVRSQLVGGFAAVTAASKLLSLNQEQMLDALGIAYCQVSASGSSTRSPALTKRLAPGLAARAGVFSARLGQNGFKADRDVLFGPKGFFRMYQGGPGDQDAFREGLGEKWEVVNVGPKGFPCCRILHAPVEATLALVKENNIKAQDVERVLVRGSRKNIFLSTGNKKPASTQKQRHPEGVVDAQFSIHWGVAAAIAKGHIFIDCFTESAINDPELNRLTELVELVAEDALDRHDILLAPVIVEITTKAGATFSKRIDYAKGNPKNPVSWEETEEAFHKSAAFAAKPLSKENIDTAIAIIRDLETVQDVRTLVAALCG